MPRLGGARHAEALGLVDGRARAGSGRSAWSSRRPRRPGRPPRSGAEPLATHVARRETVAARRVWVVDDELLAGDPRPCGHPRGPRLRAGARRALLRGRDGRGRAARARGAPPRAGAKRSPPSGSCAATDARSEPRRPSGSRRACGRPAPRDPAVLVRRLAAGATRLGRALRPPRRSPPGSRRRSAPVPTRAASGRASSPRAAPAGRRRGRGAARRRRGARSARGARRRARAPARRGRRAEAPARRGARSSRRRARTATSSWRSSSGSERRLEALGQVNPLAKEEYEREKERLAELVEQREDLEQSLAELEELRAQLTEAVDSRFDETFDGACERASPRSRRRSSRAARAG